MEVTHVACVGAIVCHGGRLLMVRRGTPPGVGLWSIPGGRVEPGETSAQATAREVAEETGLAVQVGKVAGIVEVTGPAGVVYVVEDFHAVLEPGADPRLARAGDDAADVGWFRLDELRTMPCVDGLLETLVRWGAVPTG